MIEVEFTTQIRIPGKHGFERKFSSEQGWTIETFGERVKLVKDGASFTVQGVPYTLLEKADPPKLVVSEDEEDGRIAMERLKSKAKNIPYDKVRADLKLTKKGGK